MSYIIQFLAFLSTISIVLFGSHIFLYLSIRHFFDLNDTVRRIILVALTLLSISFIVASLLAHWYDNFFSRGLYYISAIWLGVLSNAFFIFAILWLLGKILLFIHFPFSNPVLGYMGVILILFSSLYGIIRAANPVIREETVYIQNLPTQWEGKKIVQMNDVHIGHIIRSDFTQKIVEMSNSVHPAIVCIVGDLFDGMDGRLDGLIEPFNALRSQYGTYFVIGNHETYLGTSKTLDIIEKTNIHVIDDKLINLDGLQFIGVTFPERGQTRDITKVLKDIGYNRLKPSVVLYHSPTNIDTFRSLGVSLQLAGHTHRGQLYPYNLITNLLFRGYDFGIFHEGNYTLSVSSGAGTWGPPIRTNSQAEIVVLTLTSKVSQ